MIQSRAIEVAQWLCELIDDPSPLSSLYSDSVPSVEMVLPMSVTSSSMDLSSLAETTSTLGVMLKDNWIGRTEWGTGAAINGVGMAAARSQTASKAATALE